MSDFWIQAIGFVGVALFIISYQIRSNRALFLCQLLGCLVFCLQFFLMGGVYRSNWSDHQYRPKPSSAESGFLEMGKEQSDYGSNHSFAGCNDGIYLGGMEKPAAIHIRCGDSGWLLDQQRTEDKAVSIDRIAVHTSI